ncbi:MAG: type II toxin-antitoxin system VapC family toxin, partial [Planctomycetes bacterium]|nr:type II toxin-antitoxin system VapC family toxin [Planctomycetota bacterium]
MVLVDTSVWIDHLRRGDHRLTGLLEQAEVLSHSLVIGELACGNIQNRATVLQLLRRLPMAAELEHPEAWQFIDAQRLFGRGVGMVDVHLLASARLSQATLWTRDRRLNELAAEL